MSRKNNALTHSNEEFDYTLEMLDELDKCSRDPLYFIRTYVRIQHPIKGQIPFDMYPYQEEMVKTIHENQQTITTISRQAGKTTIVAAYVLWYVCFNDDKTVLVTSNKNSNAMEIVKRITYAYEMLPKWLKPAVDPATWNKHEMGFANKSRIVSQATTENTGRGLSISLMICDELAFVNPRIADEFWASMSPTLSTGGKAAIISTPNGDTNLFATLFRGAVSELNGMKALFYDWRHVPHITQDFINAETAKMGELKVRQEYGCEFLSSEELLINSIVLNNMTTKITLKPQESSKDKLVFFEPIAPSGATYVVGVDPSKGTGNDFHAVIVMRVAEDGKFVQTAEYRSNTAKTGQLYAMLKSLLIKLDAGMRNQVFFTFENNAVGEGLSALYHNDPEVMHMGNAFMASDHGQTGMNTNGKTKIRACLMLKDMIEGDRIEINSMKLLHELKNYVRTKGSYAAQYGSTDDLVSAMLLCTRVLKDHVSQYDMDVFNAIHNYDEQFSDADLVFLPSFL